MYAAAVGSWTPSDEKCLQTAASHASTQIDFASLDDATRRMEEHAEEQRCVFVSHETNLGAVVGKLRERASLLTVPVIAVVPHPSESVYLSVFASGADDALVSGDRGGITRRLANLLIAKPPQKNTRQAGLALVASSDIALRRTLGKTMRRAGFDVIYATEAREVVELAKNSAGLSLVVATDDFPPMGGEAAIRSARTAACKPNLPALVVPADAQVGWTPSGDLPVDGKLLAFAEEVARGSATDQRISKRLPFGTLCAFRPAGGLHPTYGLTHNMSREGLFVRTLDAPRPGGEVWLEMRAPEAQAIIHLRGNVVWRREPGAVGATPFGFGLRLTPETCPPGDSAQFIAGYDALLASLTNLS
ncbi:MAG TPA: PilZ domain-containing protein [Polyangiales bacterium]|nr:PilZ domain-containing protein [Polyangiales bacterium]